MMLLTACQDGTPGLKRTLPEPPAICKPVEQPVIKRGENAKVALARVAAAFLSANGHLAACVEWYEGVRAAYLRGEL